jgi:hypothetical protein
MVCALDCYEGAMEVLLYYNLELELELELSVPTHFYQCYGSGFNQGPGSGSRRAKMTNQPKIEKELIISFFEVLDVLFLGLKDSPLALTSLKVHKIEIFFCFDFEICITSLLVMSKY